MSSERGHLKVFIGMAPGVGKTYRMLQEGAAEAVNGRDVAIGYLEPHGRERVPAALNHFFKIENLSALRETALRQVAEDVEVKRLVRVPAPVLRRDEEGLAAPPEAAPRAITERLLALATLAPESEHVVRRAWRSAQRLDAELDVLVVRPPGRPPSPEDRKRLEELRRLTAMLGVRLHVEEAEDVAAVAIATARSLGSTYVLMGRPASRRGLGRLLRPSAGHALLSRLLDELPGIDVRIIADRDQHGSSRDPNEPSRPSDG
jgi:two-component system sensor histidine kinase KdpD